MLRVIHNQTTAGAILVDDIDDNLPNKTASRTGGTGNPDAYARDGYANSPKQPCYVSYHKPTDTSLPGYIDVFETQRVSLSAGKGKIQGLSRAGLVTVVQFQESDIAQPVVTVVNPVGGDLHIVGTNMLSLTPNYTSVIISGTGAVVLTQAQIIVAGGSVSDTLIVLPAVLDPGGWAVGTTFVVVHADDLSSTPAVAVT